MRRLLICIAFLVVLTGCRAEESVLSQAVSFRGKLVSSGGCSFRAEITADYGDYVHCFTVDCDADVDGTVQFTVLEPETITGISGKLTEDGGCITYDGLQLAFELLASDQISPVSAPGYMANCWLKEYILSAGQEDRIYRVTYEKKINGKDLLLDTCFENDIPISADLCYNGYRILHLKISDFAFH